MLHFTYDFDKYEEKRGMYFDVRDFLSGATSEDGIFAILKCFNIQEEKEKTVAFRNKYMNFYGEASKKTVDCIADHIM
jgi:CDP-glycerol glycerophosphotransferase